jgi:hypothetical protein
MLKKMLIVAAAALSGGSAFAATPGAAGTFEWSADSLMADQAPQSMAGNTLVSEADVGDADSFAREKTYLGVSQTLPVVIQSDCTGWDPADGACIVPNAAPAATSVDEPGMGSIDLPGNATETLLCFTATQFATWIWHNTTVAQSTGEMNLFLTVQIENDVLLGLDDANGVPFNGTLFPIPTPIIVSSHQHTLPPGASELQRERTTRSCTGGLVSARTLRAQGLTEAQVKGFFKEPMTVIFGIQGTVQLVDFGSFSVGVRLYGD